LARKILLADDSVTAQNMGRKILTDAGYDVVTVNNGSAALKRVAELKPDLIVLDVYMPGYSGLEVCARLKEAPETSRIPILLTVGKLEPFKPEEATRVRADGFIVKPFEASELLSALTRLEDVWPAQADGSRLHFGFRDRAFQRRSHGQEICCGDATMPDGRTGCAFLPRKERSAEPEPARFCYPVKFPGVSAGAGKAPQAALHSH
jgi:CheY-like chemotaxis protein